MTIRNPRILFRGEREQAMLNRVVARTTLNDTRDASMLRAILSAAAAGDEQNAIKILSLLDLFSIDRAERNDLDERAADYGAVLGGNLPPRTTGRAAQGSLEFVRSSSSGVITIAAGTRVQRSGGGRRIAAVTTVVGTIADGATTSGFVTAVAEQTGSDTNSEPGTFTKLLSRTPGVNSVTNSVPFIGGEETESDGSFRERIKNYIRSLPLCTPKAFEALALQVELSSGQRVLSAKAVERDDQPGRGILYIDDGTGTVAAGAIQPASGETVVAVATGGETRLQLQRYPVVSEMAISVIVNGTLQTRDDDYFLMPGTGAVHLSETSFPIGLTAADTVTASYSYYTGLIAETQWRVDGRADSPVLYPGWRAFGAHILVKPPITQFITIDAVITMKPGYVRSTAASRAKAAISQYINYLPIGSDVIRNEVIERIMVVPGIFDLNLTSPSSNVPIGDTTVARVIAAGLLIR